MSSLKVRKPSIFTEQPTIIRAVNKSVGYFSFAPAQETPLLNLSEQQIKSINKEIVQCNMNREKLNTIILKKAWGIFADNWPFYTLFIKTCFIQTQTNFCERAAEWHTLTHVHYQLWTCDETWSCTFLLFSQLAVLMWATIFGAAVDCFVPTLELRVLLKGTSLIAMNDWKTLVCNFGP